VKFLVDRCAGRRLADWLRAKGHDVIESRERGPDPGDRVLLKWAAREERVLVTIDTDFGDWYKTAMPRAEVREGRSFQPDEFAIALEQMVRRTALEDDSDPETFFSRTYFAQALRVC
jgi:uncharacterized protein with PIN domain